MHKYRQIQSSLIAFVSILTLYCLLFKWWYYSICSKAFENNEQIILSTASKSTELIVCVKNEAQRIESFLEQISKQDFAQNNPTFSCVIVNDYSSETEHKSMQSISMRYPFVHYINNQKQAGKKHAQAFAIHQSNAEHIIVTDIDCHPNSTKWLSSMTSALNDYELVLGHAPFTKKSNCLNKLSRFEAMWIGAQFLSAAQSNRAYMGVGRNMAFRRSSYLEAFDTIKGKQLISGDDDLFVQAIANKYSITTITSPDCFMYSQAENSYNQVLRQKSRQITTSMYYSFKQQIILGQFGFTQIVTFPLILLLFILKAPYLACIGLLGHLLFSYIYLRKCAIQSKEEDLINLLYPLDILYGIHLIILTFYSFARRKGTWK